MTITQLLSTLNEDTNLHARMDNDTLYLEGQKFLTVDTSAIIFWQHTSTILHPAGLLAVAKYAAQFSTDSNSATLL